MLTSKIYFERVPIEIAKGIAEKDRRGREMPEETNVITMGEWRNQPVDEELKFPEWQLPLQEVILEFDPEKLNEKAKNIETLIAERFQLLQREGGGREEQQALCDGLSILRSIKREKLGFPD